MSKFHLIQSRAVGLIAGLAVVGSIAVASPAEAAGPCNGMGAGMAQKACITTAANAKTPQQIADAKARAVAYKERLAKKAAEKKALAPAQSPSGGGGNSSGGNYGVSSSDAAWIGGSLGVAGILDILAILGLFLF